jgi:hypothetical protein
MKKSLRLSRLLPSARRQSFLRPDVSRRPLCAEPLEARSLMAGLPGMLFASNYNAKMPADVNNDGAVKVDDAIAVISTLRKQGSHEVGGEGEAAAQTVTNLNANNGLYYDVNADGMLNVVDAVSVIRTIREQGGEGVGEDVQFRVIATPVGGDGTTAITSIEKGQEFDLVVYVRDMRPKGSFSGVGGIFNPKVDVQFDATKAHIVSDEVQYLIIRGTPTSGTFTVTFDGQTKTVNYSSSTFTTGSNIQAALESIATIGAGNVQVVPLPGLSDPTNTGSPMDNQRWAIRFVNQLKDTNVPKIVGNASGLAGATEIVIDDGTTKNLAGNTVEGLGFQGRIDDSNAFQNTPWFTSAENPEAADFSTVVLNPPYGDLGLGESSTHTINGLNEFGAFGTLGNPPQGGLGSPTYPDFLFMRIRMVATAGGPVAAPTTFSMNANPAGDDGSPLLFIDPNFDPVPTVAGVTSPLDIGIRQYVDAITDLNGGSRYQATVGGSAISIDVLTNDNVAKDPSVSAIHVTRVGSSPDSPTGNYFASNSLKSELGGSVSILPNGQVQYTPPPSLPAGSPLVDRFVYTVEDVNIASRTNQFAYRDTVVVEIDLQVPNLAASNDVLTLAEAANTANNTPPVSYDLNLLANDSLGTAGGVHLDTLDLTNFNAGLGTLTIINGGLPGVPQVRFTPTDPDFFSATPITFGYTLRDAATPNNVSSATVSLTITNTNDAPVVPARTGLTAEEGSTTSFNALTGATPGPANESTQTLTLVGPATALHGTVVVNGNNLDYTPAVGYLGPDTITYTLRDNGTPQLSTQGTISLTVTPIARPTAVNDDYTIDEGTTTFQMNVLSNDRPHVGSNPTLVSFDASAVPANLGTVTGTLGAGGFLTFTLNPAATDEFTTTPIEITYTIADDSGSADDPGAVKTATVSLSIANVNDAPTAEDKTAIVGKNPASVTINVLQNATVGPTNESGSDTLSVSAVTQGSKGVVTIGTGGNVIYTPNPGQSGVDTFTYTLRDRPAGDAAGLTVTKTVTVNITPNAVNDTVTVGEDSLATDAETTLDVLGNDTQSGFSGTLSVTAVTQGAHGTVTIINGGANVRYIPVANFYGTDSFTYTMTDGVRTATATVNVNISEKNDNPTANLATATIIRAFGQQEINLLPFVTTAPDNAANTNGTPVSETLSITAITATGSAGGTAIVSGGRVLYTPPAVSPPSGTTDDFTYTVSDNRGGSSTGTLKITLLDYVPTNVGGYVYHDGAGGAADGVRNPGEAGYGGVKITITGTDFLGVPFNASTTTKADGSYLFPAMIPGTYDIIEDQPAFVVDGAENVGAQGGSVTSQFNATTGARDTIRISFPVTGAPNGALGNNFGEKGLNVVALSQSNQALGGPTGNIWLADLAASATRAGFLMYVDGNSISISQTINGWANLASITGSLTAANQLTVTFTPLSGTAITKVLTLNAGTANGFRILGLGENGSRLVRIDASAAQMLGSDPSTNPFLPAGSGAGGEGENFAAGVDAVFAGG